MLKRLARQSRKFDAKYIPDGYDLGLNIGVLRGINLFCLCAEAVMLVIDLVLGLPIAPALLYVILFSANQRLMHSAKRYLISANTFVFLTFSSVLICIIVYGGMHSVALVWIPFFCTLSFYLLGRTMGFAWSIVAMTLLPLAGWLSTSFGLYSVRLDFDHYVNISLIAIEVIAISSVAISLLFVNSRNAMVRDIHEEKTKVATHLYDKKVLLATICHDLGTPISVMLHVAGRQKEIMEGLKKKGMWPQEEEKLFDLIAARHASAISHACEIIHQARLLEALDYGKTELSIERIDLFEVVTELKSMFESRLFQKKLRFEVDIAEPVLIAEKASLINSVLGNLMTNAIKFSNAGGIITLKSRKNGDYTEIEVSDCGVGVPPAIIKDLFSLERRTSRLGTSGEKGTGFGLPIVKRFIAAYHGEISVSSNSDPQKGPTGTSFILRLPSSMTGVMKTNQSA